MNSPAPPRLRPQPHLQPPRPPPLEEHPHPYLPTQASAAPPPAWRGYAGAAGLCGAAAAVAWPLATAMDNASLVLVFLLAVVLTAAIFGRGPALLASGLSVLLFNLAFVPPRFSLSVADQRFVFTFAVMLVVGLIVGQLTAGLKAQAHAAQQRERQVRSLYGMSRDLGQALTAAQVAETVERFVQHHFGARLVLWAQDRSGRLQPLHGTPDAALSAHAERVIEAACEGRPPPAARPAGPPALVVALQGTMAVRGALALLGNAPPSASVQDRHAAGPAWDPTTGPGADRPLLDTCAALVGSTLERIHYIDVARANAVEIEGEQLRNSLLAAVSHDLRTPLASLVGLSESLQLTRPAPTPQQAEIAAAMAATARRMSALVSNLLDMARLESGTVRLDLQWQPVEEVLGSALAAAAPVLASDRVDVQLGADLPLVRLDAVLMERVLVNLLENAAKYTPPDARVLIEATVAGDAFEIAVSDNGPGLPAGRHQALLRKFERGARESATPGVGLGLALCSAIVQAHGGRFTAGDAPGGGARFVLQLPLGLPPPVPGTDDPGGGAA